MFDHRDRCSSLTAQLKDTARCGRSGESSGGAELKLRAADSISDSKSVHLSSTSDIKPTPINTHLYDLLPPHKVAIRPFLTRDHHYRILSTADHPAEPQACLSMATMAAESSPSGAGSDSTSTGRLPMPSRNPLPLSASQEAQVREIFYERVRGYCGPEIKGTHRKQFLATNPPLSPSPPPKPLPQKKKEETLANRPTTSGKQHSQPAPSDAPSRSPLPAASRTG